jgi:hypothetical protein
MSLPITTRGNWCSEVQGNASARELPVSYKQPSDEADTAENEEAAKYLANWFHTFEPGIGMIDLSIPDNPVSTARVQ